MLLLVKYTLLYSTVLLLVALGGMFSERSGVINIALEGIMEIGGLAGILTVIMLGESASPFTIIFFSILISAVCGMLFSLLLAYSAVSLNADQIISGTALNMMALSFTVVLVKLYNNAIKIGGSQSPKLAFSNNNFIYHIGGFTFNVFLPLAIVLLIISYIFLFKTKYGLRLRACGEHPQAADSVGVNVFGYRYLGVAISGVLGGIGGFAYILPAVTLWNFEVGVTGFGFLALAVVIFGQWNPFKIAGAAVFFALFKTLANVADSTIFTKFNLSQNTYNMMPFIASLAVLIFTARNSAGPKAAGIPYDKGQR